MKSNRDAFAIALQVNFTLWQETQERLAKEEEVRSAIEQAKKKAETEIKELKKDIEDLELVISKVNGAWKPK